MDTLKTKKKNSPLAASQVCNGPQKKHRQTFATKDVQSSRHYTLNTVYTQTSHHICKIYCCSEYLCSTQEENDIEIGSSSNTMKKISLCSHISHKCVAPNRREVMSSGDNSPVETDDDKLQALPKWECQPKNKSFCLSLGQRQPEIKSWLNTQCQRCS